MKNEISLTFRRFTNFYSSINSIINTSKKLRKFYTKVLFCFIFFQILCYIDGKLLIIKEIIFYKFNKIIKMKKIKDYLYYLNFFCFFF